MTPDESGLSPKSDRCNHGSRDSPVLLGCSAALRKQENHYINQLDISMFHTLSITHVFVCLAQIKHLVLVTKEN